MAWNAGPEPVGSLTDPTAHGGSAEDAFHLVLPSLPGYGFSAEPAEAGWNVGRVALAWAELMRRLGCTRYVAQVATWAPPSPRPHLLQRGRQGRSLRRLGRARAVRDRDPAAFKSLR